MRHQPGAQKLAASAGIDDILKCAIGGLHEPSRKYDPFRLVRLEQRRSGTTGEHLRQFPGQIHRIADAGVHALSA